MQHFRSVFVKLLLVRRGSTDLEKEVRAIFTDGYSLLSEDIFSKTRKEDATRLVSGCGDRRTDRHLKYVLPCSNQGLTMVTIASMKAKRTPLFGQLWTLEFIFLTFPYCSQQIIAVEIIKLALLK